MQLAAGTEKSQSPVGNRLADLRIAKYVSWKGFWEVI